MDNSKDNHNCPNCLAILPPDAKFCHNCGQKRTHPEDHSVWHLIVESVGDFFHFDSKFITTLLPLLFRPGFLTEEYMQGRRARYFQPFKFFLFISFLYFLTAGLINHKKAVPDANTAPVLAKQDSTGVQLKSGSYTLHLDAAYDKIQAIPDDSLKKVVKKYGLNRFVNLTYPRASWYSRFMIKQVLKNRLQGSETFAENMNKTVPKLIFILIPFIALLLKLLYVRKKIPYFNHIIFSLHFLSFVFLLLWIKEFGSLLTDRFNLFVYLLILVYLFFALLKVYPQKIRATFTKFLLLFFGSLIMLAFFFIIAASISFLMI